MGVTTTVQWDGLDAFMAALTDLPVDLTQEADAIVQAHTDEAERKIGAAYPRVTGELQGSFVQRARALGQGVVGKTLANTAPQAHWYEYGTVHQGAKPTFVPISMRQRSLMVAALMAMVRREGFTVHAAEGALASLALMESIA